MAIEPFLQPESHTIEPTMPDNRTSQSNLPTTATTSPGLNFCGTGEALERTAATEPRVRSHAVRPEPENTLQPSVTQPTKTTIAVQWNLRGLAVRTSELQQLLQQHCPVVVALQEIKTKKEKDRNKMDRRRYEWRFCFKPSDGFSSGAALGVLKDVPHRFLDVRGPLQVVAARVEWPVAATFASIYICREDGRAEIEEKLDQLIQQLPGPIVLLGDFNAHSPLWGGTYIDARGRAIEEVISKYQLIVINDQQHTRIDPRDGGTSAIDLSIVSETVAHELTWSVDDDTRGSDHYPIFLNSAEHSRATVTRRQRWRYEEANWEQFELLIKSKNPGMLKKWRGPSWKLANPASHARMGKLGGKQSTGGAPKSKRQ